MTGIPLTGGSPTSQTSTQDPQGASLSVGGPSQQESSALQPNTTTHPNGIPLNTGSLLAVSLSGTTASVSTAKATPTHHHVNPALLGMTIVFFAVAAYLFWLVSHTAKNTTEY